MVLGDEVVPPLPGRRLKAWAPWQEPPPQAMAVGALLEIFEFPPRHPSLNAPSPEQLESTLLAAGTNVDGKMFDEPFLAPDGELPAMVGRARRN